MCYDAGKEERKERKRDENGGNRGNAGRHADGDRTAGGSRAESGGLSGRPHANRAVAVPDRPRGGTLRGGRTADRGREAVRFPAGSVTEDRVRAKATMSFEPGMPSDMGIAERTAPNKITANRKWIGFLFVLVIIDHLLFCSWNHGLS